MIIINIKIKNIPGLLMESRRGHFYMKFHAFARPVKSVLRLHYMPTIIP